MHENRPGEAWVFHAGALGDFILIWPLIRTIARRYTSVHVVADSEKAALAAACVEPFSITPHDAQARAFTRLWTGSSDPEVAHTHAARVVNAVADPDTPAGTTWLAAATAILLVYVIKRRTASRS